MVAFTRDEALEYVSRQYEVADAAAGKAPTVGHEYRLETAADIAQAMREYLDDHLKSWA